MAPAQGSIIKTTLAVLVGLLVMCSFALFVSSCASARDCYVDPCYEGDGLDMLWSVHDGEGFYIVVVSLLTFAHSLFAFYVLFKAPFSKMNFGMLISSSMTLACVMLVQAIYWGIKGRMIVDLDAHIGKGGYFFEQNEACNDYDRTNPRESCENLGHHCVYVYYPVGGAEVPGCYRGMKVSFDAKHRFDAVVAFSVLLCVTNGILSLALLAWRSAFIGHAQSAAPPLAAKPAPETQQEPSYAPYGGEEGSA